MRTLLRGIAGLSLCAIAACDMSRSSVVELPTLVLRDSVAARIRSLTSAATARDASRFLAHFDSSASFRWATQGEVEDFGAFATAYRRGWARPVAEWNVTMDSTWIEVVAADAIVATWSGVLTEGAPDGRRGSFPYVATGLWRRMPQGWLLVSGHESFLP